MVFVYFLIENFGVNNLNLYEGDMLLIFLYKFGLLILRFFVEECVSVVYCKV